MSTTGAFEAYERTVKDLEGSQGLAPYAKHSFEAFTPSNTCIDGTESREYFKDALQRSNRSSDHRTPLQRERDRIVHSLPLRNLAEKFHVIYYRDQRISRNYITHVMRMAQITRAICRGLNLNPDFGEAIALGSLVGITPFKHVAKTTVAEWAQKVVARESGSRTPKLALAPNKLSLPPWLLDCPEARQEAIQRAIPIAKMRNSIDSAYSNGKQSYLLLMTNPYLRIATPEKWQADTAYGIWRHSLDHQNRTTERDLEFTFDWDLAPLAHRLSWQNDTYEAMVVRLVDDITWVIENLQDAHYAGLVSSKGSHRLFSDIHLETSGVLNEACRHALTNSDVSDLYHYFIVDCVEHTRECFRDAGDDALLQRNALRDKSGSAPRVSLSESGFETLSTLKGILEQKVFGDPRTVNRNKVLSSILEFAADQLYGNPPDSLPEITRHWIDERSRRFPYFDGQKVISRASKDPFVRVQITLNILSELGDADIFQMVGMGTI